jgi:Ca2+-binding RTX toxin-like protein
MAGRLAVALAAVAALVLGAGAALGQVRAQDAITCDPSGVCFGTPKNDRITGTDGDDEIRARRGEDQVDARGGEDLVLGQRGDDHPGQSGRTAKRLEGGAGDDTVKGGDGKDSVTDFGANDADRLFGGRQRDFVDGADGDARDYLDCGPAVDFFDAEPQDTVLPNCERPF